MLKNKRTIFSIRLFYTLGEFLIHKGDALAYIYYIWNGSMEVMQNSMVVAILGEKIFCKLIT
jgi:hypothetical protein